MGALNKAATFALVGILALVTGPAFAQVDNTALAEELFNDAKRLLDQGKADQACPKFAESLRLDPTQGTRLNLAHCYEVQGRTAKAWGQYKEIVRTGAGDAKRSAIARQRITALEQTLARTVINGSADLGLKLKVDGEALDTAVIGTSFPIDPGDHTLELSAPSKKPRVMTFHATAGQTQSVDFKPLEDITASQVTEEPKQEPPPTRQEGTTEVSQGKQIGGWVMIGVGVATTGVGIAFGVITLGLASDVANGCTGGACPTPALIDKNSSAHTDALLADIMIPVGVIAAGIGIYLVATASHHTKAASTMGLRVTPLVSTSGGGVSIGGRF